MLEQGRVVRVEAYVNQAEVLKGAGLESNTVRCA
jgi:hypothetical protein